MEGVRMMSKRGMIFLGALVVLTLALNSCVVDRFQVGPMRTDYENVEVGAAEAVRAEIVMNFGEIKISGGAGDLMEAELSYNVDELEPRVSYDISGSTGELTVKHRDIEDLPLGDYEETRSEWELSFNDDVPMDMTLTMGATRGDIDLRGLELANLNLEVGAAQADLSLGDGPLRNLDIEMGAGDLTIDMANDWDSDLTGEITSGVGKLTIYLPSDVGVVVDVEMGIVTIETKGLQKDGNRYTNDAFGESEVTLRLQIEGGVGDIHLEVR